MAGLVRLPARIVAAFRSQREKRVAPDRDAIAAEQRAGTIRFVADTRAKAEAEGVGNARRWLVTRPGGRADKARALVELALDRVTTAPDEAVAIGEQALALGRREPRLWVLADALYAAGYVAAPARLIAGLAARAPSASYRRLADQIRADELRLEGEITRPVQSRPGVGRGDALIVAAGGALPLHEDAVAWRAEAALITGAALGCSTKLVTRAPDARTTATQRYDVESGPTVIRLPWQNADEPADPVVHAREALAGADARLVHLVCSGGRFDETLAEAAAALDLPLLLDVGALGRLVVTDHAHERSQAARAHLRALGGLSSAVIARSAGIVDALMDLGISATLVPDVPPRLRPSTAEMIADLRGELAIAQDHPVLAVIAPLDPDPGFDGLIDLLPLLPSWCLLITGAGPARPDLEQRAAAIGCSAQLRFAGPALPGDIATILGMSRALLLPRDDAGAIAADITGAALAAAALGVPIIASMAEAAWLRGTGIDPGRVLATIADLPAALADVRRSATRDRNDVLATVYGALGVGRG